MGNYVDERTLIEINNLPSERWKVRRVRMAYDKELRRLYKEYPNIISQVRRKDLELEQYRDELSDRIDRNRGRMVKTLWGGNTNSWHTMEKKYITREKYKYNSIENKPLHEIMEEYKEEKEVWEFEQKI